MNNNTLRYDLNTPLWKQLSLKDKLNNAFELRAGESLDRHLLYGWFSPHMVHELVGGSNKQCCGFQAFLKLEIHAP